MRTRVVAVMATILTVVAAALPTHAPATAARSLPSPQMQMVPAPGSVVAARQVVTVTFDEPVASVTAGWGVIGGSTQSLLLEVAQGGMTADVTLPSSVPQARPHRMTISATTIGGQTLAGSADYFGVVTSVQRRLGPTTRVMTGQSTVYGTAGRLFRFTIEVQRPMSSQMQSFAQEALRVLTDPTRGWTARGKYRLQRIADPQRADIRLMVARPPVVDRLCLKAGLHTGGMVSCWNHQFAALNSDRWMTGALSGGFRSLTDYRTYLISHEFGHGLHLHHAYCPRPGALAPVMQQQTGGQDGCRSNGWPYPR